MAKPIIARNVNFLPQGAYITEQELQRRQTVLRVSVLGLVIYLVIAAGVLVVSFYLTSQKQQLNQSIASITSQIQALRSQEASYIAQIDRLKKITPVLSSVANSTDFPQIIAKIKQALPPEVKIGDITTKDNSLVVEVEIANSQVLDQIETAVSSLAGQINFAQVKISELRRSDSTGIYKAAINFTQKSQKS